MNEQQWNAWCRDVVKRLTNVEKTLDAYNKTQKRMLWLLAFGFTAVLGIDLLLFYI
jgi:hypothetical protein